MNAKQRYRERLKVRAALTRVLEVLHEVYRVKGIERDATTNRMIAKVVAKLTGLELNTGGVEAFAQIIKARQRETFKRAKRRKKQ